MEDFDLRPVTAGDLPGLRRVYLAAWQHEFGPYLAQPLSLDQIEERSHQAFLSPTGLVAIRQGHPLGYLLHRPSTQGIEVMHWYVDPRCQGEGIGKAIATHALQSFAGARAVWWAWQDNLRANQAYLAMGANRSGRRKVEQIGGTRFSYQHWQL